jgi:hypothetical protein
MYIHDEWELPEWLYLSSFGRDQEIDLDFCEAFEGLLTKSVDVNGGRDYFPFDSSNTVFDITSVYHWEPEDNIRVEEFIVLLRASPPLPDEGPTDSFVNFSRESKAPKLTVKNARLYGTNYGGFFAESNDPAAVGLVESLADAS